MGSWPENNNYYNNKGKKLQYQKLKLALPLWTRGQPEIKEDAKTGRPSDLAEKWT